MLNIFFSFFGKKSIPIKKVLMISFEKIFIDVSRGRGGKGEEHRQRGAPPLLSPVSLAAGRKGANPPTPLEA